MFQMIEAFNGFKVSDDLNAKGRETLLKANHCVTGSNHIKAKHTNVKIWQSLIPKLRIVAMQSSNKAPGVVSPERKQAAISDQFVEFLTS